VSGDTATIIQGTPKRSTHMPNAGEKKVSVNDAVTCPPSASASNTRRASSASSTETLTLMPWIPVKVPVGSSEPIT
jgi:hypothetical protein